MSNRERSAGARREALQRMPSRAGRGRDWYRFENVDHDAAEIYIYDVIGWPFISANDFVMELREIDAARIIVHINSPGGEVFDGIAIYNALRDHPASIEVVVDSLAASIASVIAMAADPGQMTMNGHSTLMIHDPWSFAWGDARDMRREADVLDRLGDTIAGIYAARAGGTVAEWRDRMLEETWYSDEEAVAAGLADLVAEADAPENRFDLSAFRNTPEQLHRHASPEARATTIRDAERALRDAGMPAARAKAVLADGWSDSETQPGARDERGIRDLTALIKDMTP